MNCRIPHRIKRYLTEPNQLQSEQKSKYSNLTLQKIKLQLNPFQALSEIRVPSVSNNRLNVPRTPLNFSHFDQKYYLHSNLKKKTKDNHLSSNSTNNGYEFTQNCKTPLPFKKSNPLFIVNTLMDILKDEKKQSTSVSNRIKDNVKKNDLENNEFSEFKGKSIKIHRVPRLVENQMNRLTKCSRRKIYSQEKSRQKQKDIGEIQLLTFYKPKKGFNQNKIQKLS